MARSRRAATRHGYLVIDKPAGWTSHDVVAKVRRIVGERRVGHAGTLDPAAVGVLPVAIGNATRTVEYLAEADKSYLADITLGVTTDSGDIEGLIIATADPSAVTRDQVVTVLSDFTELQFQTPPMHSAIKVDGRPLYELARRGETIDVAARPITIHAATLLDWRPPVLRVEVCCSKGTYIRSLARDIGTALGVGAHLSRLVRTRVGDFRLENALAPFELEAALASSGWDELAIPPDMAMTHLPALVLNEVMAIDWTFGRQVPAAGASSTVRVYDGPGNWLGVGAVDPATGLLQPVKVVPRQNQDAS